MWSVIMVAAKVQRKIQQLEIRCEVAERNLEECEDEASPVRAGPSARSGPTD